MAKIKITKSVVDAAQPQAQPVEPRATLVLRPPVQACTSGSQGVYAPVPARMLVNGASPLWLVRRTDRRTGPFRWRRSGWQRFAGAAILSINSGGVSTRSPGASERYLGL